MDRIYLVQLLTLCSTLPFVRYLIYGQHYGGGTALFHFPFFVSRTEIVLNYNATFAEFQRQNFKCHQFVLSHIPDIFRIFSFISILNYR